MNSCLHAEEHEQQAPTCHMYCAGLISRVVCLVIRLVDIDRNRVAPLACHLAARVITSHERLYTRSNA